MSDAERTRNMSDAEVLEDLKAQRKPRQYPVDLPDEVRYRNLKASWGTIVLYLFAGIGVLFVLVLLAGGFAR